MSDLRLQAKVSRLRQIIAESVPVQQAPSVVEADEWRRYQQFAMNDPLPAFDASENARRIRNINRIAGTYRWIGELQRMLDAHGASSLQSLDEQQLAEVHDRFITLEHCYREGCDLPDAPHAW